MEAQAATDRLRVTSLVVVSPDGRLPGILTRRDVMRGHRPLEAVGPLMTPRERLVTGGPDTGTEEAARLLRDARVEKLPLVDDDDRLVGLITLRDLLQRAERPEATKDSRGRLAVGAAIGVRGDFVERAQALQEAGADVLVLDIAHGHAEHAVEAVGEVRGARSTRSRSWRATSRRPRVRAIWPRPAPTGSRWASGPGSVCTTRVVAGVGVPQFTAVLECAEACARVGRAGDRRRGHPRPGDVAKAIAAGARRRWSATSSPAGTESPGVVVRRRRQLLKVFRGMASLSAAATRFPIEARDDELDQYVPEGEEMEFPLRGPVSEVVTELAGGLRSGMSYVDATSVHEFWDRASYVQQTEAGERESRPGQGG